MKSYKQLRAISEEIDENCSLGDSHETKELLQKRVSVLFESFSNDFNLIFGQELVLKQYHLFVDDDTYRQGATGCILETFIEGNKDSIVRTECLIHQNRIWIKIKGLTNDKEVNAIMNILEKQSNHNGVELKEIKL